MTSTMDPIIFQTDPPFSEVDHLEGCCIFTLGYIAAKAVGVQFSTQNMQTWLQQGRAQTDSLGTGMVIGANDYLQDPQALIDLMCGGHKLVYKGLVDATYQPQTGEFCQDYLFNPDSVTANNPDGFHHFVIGWTGPGQDEYDPICYGPGQGSNTASAPNTYIESKRLYALV